MLKKVILMLLMVLLWLCMNCSQLFSCSTFVTGEKKQVYFGRNYDFITGVGFVVVNPRNLIKTALVYPGETPAEWTAKYGSITFNQVGREFPTGGMNEAGLVVECMGLYQTQYPFPDKRPAVMELQWMQYLLDTCATVSDIEKVDKQIRIQKNCQPIHFLICDRKGNTAVVEFINYRTFFFRIKKSEVRVLTNSTYADSLYYLKRFEGFGGKEKIPDTAYSVDRFARLAKATLDKKPNVIKAFEWLKLVQYNGKDSPTQWSIVYDPVRLVIHFFTRKHKQVRKINLKDFSFDCSQGSLVMDLGKMDNPDIRKNFTAFTSEMNSRFVQRTFKTYKARKFVTDIPDAYLVFLGNYPSSLKCKNNRN
jgi:choloylglycine hydrolase